MEFKNYVFLFLGLSICSNLRAESTKTVFNPFTGKLDFITAVNGTNFVSGTGVTVSCSNGSCTFTSTGSGGSSSLQVTLSGVQISSPTASLNLYSGDFLSNLVNSVTAQVALNPATTDFIQNNPASVQTATITINGTINTNSTLNLNGGAFLSDDANSFDSVFLGKNITYPASPSRTTCIGNAACSSAANTAARLTVLGAYSGNGGITGADNTIVGASAGQAITSSNLNVCVGNFACNGLTTNVGGSNVAVGELSMPHATTGSNNVCVGQDACDLLTTGLNDVAIGPTAAGDLTTGAQNVCIGGNTFANGQACTGVKIGSMNVMVGAGATGPIAVVNQANSSNTFVGANAGANTGNQVNESICLGYNCQATSSFTAVIGGIGTADAVTVQMSSFTASSGTLTGQMQVGTLQGASLSACGDATHALNWTGGNFGCQSIAASGGSSALGVSSGSAIISVIISSPTSNVVFDSNTFVGALQGATTAVIYVSSSGVLYASSATATYLTQSSATATYLQKSSATATYLQLSSATATYLQSSSATATYATLKGTQTFSGANVFQSSVTITPNNANAYALWIATAPPGTVGITTYVYVSTGGTNAASIMSVNNSTNSTVPVMIMNGQEELILNDYGLQNAMQIVEKGSVSTSFTTGGAFNIFMDTITHGPGMGSGMVIYSPDNAPIDNLVNLRTDSPAYNQNVLFISGNGNSHLLSINDTSTGTASSAANIVSSNNNLSALQVSGQEVGFGTIKASHTGTGSDTSSSVLSMDMLGTGTASQGIFLKSSAATGTTGKLVNIRNPNTERFVIRQGGDVNISASTSTSVYQLFMSTTPGLTQDSVTLAVSTNAEIVVNGSTGTSGQALTSQGPGLPVKWTTITGSGGGGITSPSTFTWVSTGTWGIQLSTASVIGGTAGVDLVQVSTNNTSTFAMKISSVGYSTFQPTATSTQAFVIKSTQGINMVSVDNTAVANTDYILKLSSGDGSVIAGIQDDSHFVSSGTAPSVSSCGTSPSVIGTDMAGVVTVGSGVTTSCTLSFALPYAQPPVCVLSDNSTAITGDVSSVATTAVTFGFSASLGGGQVYYICIGNKG